MSGRRVARFIAIALFIGALGQGAVAAYVPIKAAVAQRLLEIAWESTEQGETSRPWPWADTWPVAKMNIAGESKALIVLAGVSGEALAFGPGWVTSSAAPGEPGDAIIAAHKDTHFEFLRGLELGMELELVQPSRSRERFRVSELFVADSRRTQLYPAKTGPSRLILVTCYPFSSSLSGGPLRFIVILNRLGDESRLGELAT